IAARTMYLGLCAICFRARRKLHPLPGGEREGVRGIGRLVDVRDRNPLTRRPSAADLSPAGRGEEAVTLAGAPAAAAPGEEINPHRETRTGEGKARAHGSAKPWITRAFTRRRAPSWRGRRACGRATIRRRAGGAHRR